MKKIFNLVLALMLSLASIFLPVTQANVLAAPGDPKSTTLTITSGIQYTEGGTGHMEFDGTHQLDSGGTVNYPSTEGTHTVKFFFSFEYEQQGYSVSDVTVNGTSVAFAPGGLGSYVFNVGEDASYDIGIAVEHTGPNKYTIIWGNPGADVQEEDMKIKNGRAEILAVYNQNGDLLPEAAYTQPGSTHGLIDEFGWANVEEGYKVVFKFIPLYGYQLVDVKANETPLESQADENQYTFIMPSTNVHFAATFAKTDDIVDSDSTKVSGGAVSLDNGAIANGTAKISVGDTTPDSAKIADFQNAAGNYNITNYLDIDFYNIFYKGKADDNDVWANQLHELDGEATITLRLSDDIDVSTVVLVHNIGDGDDFEIIEIDSYDQAAHTITFRTRSFSNFAIATKDKVGTPDSGFVTKENDSAVATISVVVLASTIITGAAWLITKRTSKQ